MALSGTTGSFSVYYLVGMRRYSLVCVYACEYILIKLETPFTCLRACCFLCQAYSTTMELFLSSTISLRHNGKIDDFLMMLIITNFLFLQDAQSKVSKGNFSLAHYKSFVSIMIIVENLFVKRYIMIVLIRSFQE
jgi:hypothetical protein